MYPRNINECEYGSLINSIMNFDFFFHKHSAQSCLFIRWKEIFLGSCFIYNYTLYWYFSFDTVGSNEEHDKEKLDKLLHHLMEVDLITDGTVARDHTQLKVGIVEA